MRGRWLACCALAVTIACGGGDGGDEAAPTTTTVSVQQVASVVAEHRVTLIDLVEFEDECDEMECLYADNIVKRWGKISDLATTAMVDLRSISKYPQEVERLAYDTVADLERVKVTYLDWTTCIEINDGNLPPCGDKQTTNERAWRDLPKSFARWDPYL